MKNSLKIIKGVLILFTILIIITIAYSYFKNPENRIANNENNSGTLATLGPTMSENKDIYMYTKAICNESNFCQDTEITCQGNKLISINPLEGAIVQHSQDWQDPRPEEDREKLC